jgi:hypothetical protein
MKTKMKKLSSVLISLILVVTMAATSVLSVNAAATSSTARIYSDYTKSPAYKNFSQFKWLVKMDNSSIIPGLKNTNVNGKNCSTMVPQGITAAKDYMFIAAYDSSGKYNSVIYVLSNTNPKKRKLLTTLVLPNSPHAGGMGFDGSYVWITNGSKVSSFKYSKLDSTIKTAVSKKKQSVSVQYHSTIKVDTTASYMTCYNKTIYVGKFNKKGNGDARVYAYSYSSDRKTLKKKFYMTVPDRTQGLCFKDGYMILSRSWNTTTTASDYISQLRVYKPSLNNPKNGVVKKNSLLKTITMPPMVEGLTTYGSYMYSGFESAAYKYYKGTGSMKACKYPTDRVIAYKFSDIIA